MEIPFMKPQPPSLLSLGCEIADIERSGQFTNYGPMNTRFETAMESRIFRGTGACLTVCNATIGLMIAIRAVVDRAEAGRTGAAKARRRYALMPSFTFAAAAHAADWAGLTPLFCDTDENDWSSSAAAEEEMIRLYDDEIAVIVPYATFGNCIDTARYERLVQRTGIPVVIDAAASLGSLDACGDAFGTGCPFPVVFSMHATKTFSTGEGGLIFSTDRILIDSLRTMGNFGFGSPRSATMPGLNSKLSEVAALLALARLEDFEALAAARHALAECYREGLPGWIVQERGGVRSGYQFMPMLPPPGYPHSRDEIIRQLKQRGISAGAYFSPHVAEQPFFRTRGVAGMLPVTERLSRRILCLPLWDGMTGTTVEVVCAALREICALRPVGPSMPPLFTSSPIQLPAAVR